MLEKIYQQAKNIESKFKHKAILLISGEGHNAPLITVIEGLNKLGFTIYTINKWSINAWYCSHIIENPNNYKFDFILSDTQFGVRWDYFDKFNLHNHLKILIDGDDNPLDDDWKTRQQQKLNQYRRMPQEIGNRHRQIQQYRWCEPMDDYQPDIIFVSQKQHNDNHLYLPFGIIDDYYKLAENKSTQQRLIDFCNIPGPGLKRKRLTKWIRQNRLPGRIHNSLVYGETKQIDNQDLSALITFDIKQNVHGAIRFCLHKDYYQVLNNSKVFIYPGVSNSAWWDSKRQWEAIASGCYILFEKPTIDMSQYPVIGIDKFSMYNTYNELFNKCNYLHSNINVLDKKRISQTEQAQKYFSSESLVRYFLMEIKKAL